MKKFLALLLAVLVLGSVLVACGGGNNNSSGGGGNSGGGESSDPFQGEDNIKLTVWAADKAIDLTKELCDGFKAKYPDKKIDITVTVQGEGDAAAQVLNDKDAAADVFSFACDQLTRLLNANALAPVFDAETIKSRNSEASLAAASTEDGTLYAFPETGDNGYYLVYDKSVVSDTDATTLEGVLEACRKAGRKFVLDAGNGFFSCMFPFTGGLTLNGIKDEVQQFNDYDEEKVVDTLEAFAKLFHDYSDIFLSSEATKISTGMAANPRIVAAGIDGSWNAAAVADALGDDFGALRLPTINVNGKDEQIVSMHGYKLIGVNKRTKFPFASQLLADYLTDKDAQLKRAEVLSWGPSNIEAVKDSVVTSNVALSAIIDQSAFSVPQVNIADTFWSPMGTLGNTLWKDNDYSRDTIKKNFEKTIANIKDE